MMRSLRFATILAAAGVCACGSQKVGGSDKGTGGNLATGGSNPGTGGASTGGLGGTGGTPGTGGAATGGAPSTGGVGAAGEIGGSAGGGGHAAGPGGAAGGPPQGGTSGAVDCTGTFGSEQMIVMATSKVILSSPTAPADELELFFVRHDTSGGGAPTIMRAQRSSRDASFGTPAEVTELASVCSSSQERGISITPDGLRLYVGCYTGTSTYTPGPVKLARRTTRDAAFTIDSMSYGNVGPQIDVTPDELTAYTSSEVDNMSPPRQYTRSSKSEPFANGQAIVGLESAQIGAPFLAADGLSLYAADSTNVDVSTHSSPELPFSTPKEVVSGQPGLSFKFPEVSADCRTIYFVRVDSANGSNSYALEMEKR